jgi:RNA polymerase sigma factor (sigma-70 family)
MSLWTRLHALTWAAKDPLAEQCATASMDWIDEQLRANEIDYGRLHARITNLLREHTAAKDRHSRVLRPQIAAAQQRDVKVLEAEDLFLLNLSLIDRAIGYVCHRNRIDRDEEEEFGSYVKFKLIESNYAIIRKFEGRSSLATYMTTVIQRMFFQYRVQMWGKWHPSVQAKRLGDKAITVERLLTRDGFAYSEVVATLTSGRDPAFTVAEVDAIYLRLPVRQPRPVLVSAVENTKNGPFVDTENELFRTERGEAARNTASTIDAALALMDPEDQLILRMRFWAGQKVPDIGRALGVDAKKLYKRIDKLLTQLKLALEKADIASADVYELLNHSDYELSFGFSVSDRKAQFGHSEPVDGLADAKVH